MYLHQFVLYKYFIFTLFLDIENRGQQPQTNIFKMFFPTFLKFKSVRNN